MLKHRLIAVIIIRDDGVVQSVRFKHTNMIHYDAIHAIETFSRWNIDEIILINVDRKKESSENFLDILNHVSKECFVPMTVGGWVESEEYAEKLFKLGADKVLVNTSIIKKPNLIRTLVERFGNQAIVASIDIDTSEEKQPVVKIDRGAESIALSIEDWVNHVEDLGVGEIFFNSIQYDGARKGYDLHNLQLITSITNLPVIAFGGAFRWKHFQEGIEAGASAVAAANIFHYTEHSTKHAKKYLLNNGIPVRMEAS